MSPLELYQRAVQEFEFRLKQVQSDQWTLPTPNTDWDVRTLVSHIVGEDLWVPPLMAGQTIAQVGSRFDGDLLKDDPLSAYRRASAAAVSAFAEPDAPGKTVHLSFGDVLGKDYAAQMFMDHLIHAWDLARAISADESLDEALVEACYDEMKTQAESWRSSGAFGPAINVPANADTQTKLLALTGRKAA